MNLRTLASADLKGKRVLIRTDFNVPLKGGQVQDKTRLEESLPTLRFLKKQGCSVVIMTHLGRPDGKAVPELKLDPVAQELSKLLGQAVPKLEDCVGAEVEAFVQTLKPGDFVLLENLRFHAEEEKNDPEFAKALARLGEIYVNDAFGTAHRAHASTEGVAHILPAYAGLLMEKEVTVLSSLVENPKHPVCLVTGGAKIDTKIGILEKFLSIADVFIIGGALANTFLAAQGHKVEGSLYEADQIETAKTFLAAAQGKQVLLPVDVVTATDIEQPTGSLRHLDELAPNEKILDLGPQTLDLYSEALKGVQTVIWNGPMGLYEKEAFSEGTRRMAQVIAGLGNTSVIGGGDTIDAIHHFNIDTQKFTHISTGGGAMLEFLEGKELPGIKVLRP